ncbi:MAG: hypothetical protein ACLR23_02415 [Clostridia bacterium]
MTSGLGICPPEEMNIDFDVTQVTSSAEYKSTAFATDSLPDIWFQMFLTSVEQLTYGGREEQLIDLSGYINETLTPNMMRIYNEYPEYLGKITSPSGAIYSLGGITNPKSAAMTFYINKQWLEEANMELPRLWRISRRRWRHLNSRGSDIVPMAGDAGDSTRYLLNIRVCNPRSRVTDNHCDAQRTTGDSRRRPGSVR